MPAGTRVSVSLYNRETNKTQEESRIITGWIEFDDHNVAILDNRTCAAGAACTKITHKEGYCTTILSDYINKTGQSRVIDVDEFLIEHRGRIFNPKIDIQEYQRLRSAGIDVECIVAKPLYGIVAVAWYSGRFATHNFFNCHFIEEISSIENILTKMAERPGYYDNYEYEKPVVVRRGSTGLYDPVSDVVTIEKITGADTFLSDNGYICQTHLYALLIRDERTRRYLPAIINKTR